MSKDRTGPAIDATRVLACLECGKCTAICPSHRAHPGFSPRGIVKQGILALSEGLADDGSMWHCLTCRLCKEVCVSDVDIPEFVRAVRTDAINRGNRPQETHDGIIQAMGELLEEKALGQDRLWWLEDDMKVHVDGKGEVLLFTGCSPFYDIIFREFDRTADIPKAAVRILNAIGIIPVLLSDERCCGHDEHWTGKEASFQRLRTLNRQAIEATGANVVVTPCPECAYALRELYELGIEVVHLSQFLFDRVRNMDGRLLGKVGSSNIAYHDPCRLGRYLGEYTAPRKLLAEIPDTILRPLPFEKEVSHCCGVSAWISCTDGNRRLRQDRLKQAEEAGAEVLVTACPKCRIHFNCYLSNDNMEPVKVKVEDLAVLLAKAMGVWR